MANTDVNPRGIPRPQDGRGKGVGILRNTPRGGRNKGGCIVNTPNSTNNDTPGYGRGSGQGNGKNRSY